MEDETFVLKLKEHVKHVKISFHSNFENNEHFKWEFLKYEIHRFTIGYSKNKAKFKREKVLFLEKKLKIWSKTKTMKKQNYNIIVLKTN